MNRKAFTLVELLVVLGIVTLLTIIVLPSVTKMISTNKDKQYDNYEKLVAEYAEAQGKTGITNLCDIDGLPDVKKACVGYVEYKDKKYKAYIHCEGDDYKTSGYNVNYSGNRKCG